MTFARTAAASAIFIAVIGAQATAGTEVVTIEPRQARIGDTIRVTISAGAPGAGVASLPPGVKEGAPLGAFKVVGVDLSTAGSVSVTLMPQQTGDLEIPELSVQFRAADGTAHTAVSPPTTIVVSSVIGEGDATLADLRPPAELRVPWPWKAILLALLAAAAIAAAGYWIAGKLRRRHASRSAPEQWLPPSMTADAWARAELDRLLARRLLEAEQFREFHIALADLIRRYIELRFRIPALERTTFEIDDEMRHALTDREVTRAAITMLERCDRVKFAKHEPLGSEVEDTIALARHVLELSAAPGPASAPTSPEAQAAAGAGASAAGAGAGAASGGS